MSTYNSVPVRVIVDGRPLLISLIENPTIDDVLITEARIQAAAIANRDNSTDGRVVDRNIRDYLVRLGVE